MTTPPGGVVDLCVPPDWAELLLPDRDQAQAYFDRLVRETWPDGPAGLWSETADVLLTWREAMLARGAVSHGVVSASQPDGTPVRWQVLTTVVELPAEPDIDVAAVLADLVRAQGDEVRHVETYETDMGLGVGLMAGREVLPPPELAGLAARGWEVADAPVQVGVAAALACAPGAPHGLLVVGVCLAQDQAPALAGLVAVMAGRSRVRPGPPGSDAEEPAG